VGRSFETADFKLTITTISLGLIYHSKALPQLPSRDTIPLKHKTSDYTGSELTNIVDLREK
jgi:hypothetical protein